MRRITGALLAGAALGACVLVPGGGHPPRQHAVLSVVVSPGVVPVGGSLTITITNSGDADDTAPVQLSAGPLLITDGSCVGNPLAVGEPCSATAIAPSTPQTVMITAAGGSGTTPGTATLTVIL